MPATSIVPISVTYHRLDFKEINARKEQSCQGGPTGAKAVPKTTVYSTLHSRLEATSSSAGKGEAKRAPATVLYHSPYYWTGAPGSLEPVW
jgi:hypothetical protein